MWNVYILLNNFVAYNVVSFLHLNSVIESVFFHERQYECKRQQIKRKISATNAITTSLFQTFQVLKLKPYLQTDYQATKIQFEIEIKQQQYWYLAYLYAVMLYKIYLINKMRIFINLFYLDSYCRMNAAAINCYDKKSTAQNAYHVTEPVKIMETNLKIIDFRQK